MKKYSNKMVLESLQLPVIEDLQSLAISLSLTANLVFFLSQEDTQGKYKVFSIPKRNDGKRKICAPCASLKFVQRWILENILYKVRLSPYCYGFRRAQDKIKSPLVCVAKEHRSNLYVLKMDLKGFYPSITRKRVYQQFYSLGYNTVASNLLTDLCTFENELPQGAVTSPYLANLVCYRMDKRIGGYCNKRGIVYTRYADDLIFSSDDRSALKGIYGMIKRIIMDEGFCINESKTQFMTPKTHKTAIGITINDGLIKAPKQMKRMVRSMIHHQVITGNYSENERIRGYVAYITSIEPKYCENIINYISSFNNHWITMFTDAVEAFNANKLYDMIPDMTIKNASDFEKEKKQMEEFEAYVFDERYSFFKKHGYEVNWTDIEF